MGLALGVTAAFSRPDFFKILSISAVVGAFGFVLLTFGRGLLPVTLGNCFGFGGCFLRIDPSPLATTFVILLFLFIFVNAEGLTGFLKELFIALPISSIIPLGFLAATILLQPF